ncbi:hypothetical protein A7K91_12595 [Paenibacillus oryzae]|uniref:Uncharacterized protein n=1 Tax=Paenibacillus oryzae TaxID=1844972 RepID=A0A1A5YFE1_9BACL|nr:hypothetical protein A7K91_12595 [Paenibacillus oryzae]
MIATSLAIGFRNSICADLSKHAKLEEDLADMVKCRSKALYKLNNRALVEQEDFSSVYRHVKS